jgi:hypothetical protein
MLAQKLLPRGLPFSLRRWLDAVPFQNLSNRAASNFVPQNGQGTLDTPITPIPILFGHPNHQGFDIRGNTRSTWTALAAAVILLRDEFPMPGQQGLRRDNGSELGQKLPSLILWP